MDKRLALLALLAAAPPALGQQPPAVPDADGFTRPLERLDLDPYRNQRIFEHSTLDALRIHDPFEALNRHVYHFNYGLDRWVLLPAVRGYRAVTPRPVRTAVSNAFANLGDVGNLANHLLQLKGERAMRTTARLLFNSLLGIGGLWDPATRMGLPRQSEDFGQTLGHWGVGAGPYLVLPGLGPSNLRDATGRLVDFGLETALDPLGYSTASRNHPALAGLRVIDTRYTTPFRYGQLNTPFEYTEVRYIYTRARALQIAD